MLVNERLKQQLLDAWAQGDLPLTAARFASHGLQVVEGDLEKLDEAIAAANGKRKARTIGRAEVIEAALGGFEHGIFVVHGGEANDGNQVTSLCLAFREGQRLTVGVGVSAARGANPGRTWKELQPWSQRPEKSLVKLTAWARARGADRVRVELSSTGPVDPSEDATSEAALLAQVIAHPDDDRPRLVLADSLQQDGDLRGELIALQIRASKCEPAEAAPLLARAEELLLEHGAKWTHELRQFTLKQRWARGFVEHVEMRAEAFAQHAGQLFALTPVRSLYLRGVQAAMVKRIAATRELERLVDLDLSHGHVGDSGARTLAESSHLSKLLRLGLVSCRVGPSGLWALLRSLGALEELRVHTVDHETARELSRAKRTLTVVCAVAPVEGIEEGLGPRVTLEVRAAPVPSAPRI